MGLSSARGAAASGEEAAGDAGSSSQPQARRGGPTMRPRDGFE